MLEAVREAAREQWSGALTPGIAEHGFGVIGPQVQNPTSPPKRRAIRGLREKRAPNQAKLMHARYYSSHYARFATVDPIPNLNLFSYVGSNPTNFIDPYGAAQVGSTGMRTILDGCLACGGGFTAHFGVGGKYGQKTATVSTNVKTTGGGKPTDITDKVTVTFNFVPQSALPDGIVKALRILKKLGVLVPFDMGTATVSGETYTMTGTIIPRPPLPAGQSYELNMEAARFMDPLTWTAHVMPYGPWDYKRQGSDYDDAGNYNFGATGYAQGFDIEVLLWGAGMAQHLVLSPWIYAYGNNDGKDIAYITYGYMYAHHYFQKP